VIVAHKLCMQHDCGTQDAIISDMTICTLVYVSRPVFGVIDLRRENKNSSWHFGLVLGFLK